MPLPLLPPNQPTLRCPKISKVVQKKQRSCPQREAPCPCLTLCPQCPLPFPFVLKNRRFAPTFSVLKSLQFLRWFKKHFAAGKPKLFKKPPYPTPQFFFTPPPNPLPFPQKIWVTELQLCFPPGPPPPPEFPLKIHKKSVGLLIYSNIISTFAPQAEKLHCRCDLSAFFI